MINNHPEVFISYSWDSEEHKDWVRSLADRLLSDGIEVKIDQYDVQTGDRLPKYMEQSITNSDYVLIICTPAYKQKADTRIRGVGYEGDIISGELFAKNDERKFKPILRSGSFADSMPAYASGKLGLDFSDDRKYADNYPVLLDELLGRKKKPAVGNIAGTSGAAGNGGNGGWSGNASNASTQSGKYQNITINASGGSNVIIGDGNSIGGSSRK